MTETKAEISNNIKKLTETNKIVLGTKVSLKELKAGNLSKVYISSNAPQEVKDDFEHYAKLSSTPLEQTTISNEDFGIICKKSFLISVVGQKK